MKRSQMIKEIEKVKNLSAFEILDHMEALGMRPPKTYFYREAGNPDFTFTLYQSPNLQFWTEEWVREDGKIGSFFMEEAEG